MVPNGMFFEQKYFLNCPALLESFRILFLLKKQNESSVTLKKQKRVSVWGGILCFLFLQLTSVAMAKAEIQLSSIFVLKTPKIHLKSVSLLGRETKSILTSN